MQARKRGKSSSKKPFRTEQPDWIELDRKEIEKLVIDLYNQGYSTSRIGIVLRDTHGVPDVKTALGVSMYDILKQNKVKMDYPEDLMNLMRRAVRMHRHMDDNHKDVHNKRQLQLTEAKIRRLVRYYVSKGVLPEGWAYKLHNAKLIVGE
jgi:small subunit ribosomal protein S15